MSPPEFAALAELLKRLAEECHDRSRLQGFWQSREPDEIGAVLEVGVKIGLIGAEAVEVLEAWREQDPFAPCAKDPRLSKVAEEMADVLIRLLDLAHFLRVDLAEAVEVKMSYNSTRPYKHSKRF